MECGNDPAGRRNLKIVGKTTDGKDVIGFFELINTYGVPMELILEGIEFHGCVPDWTGFIEDAVQHKWSLRSTITKLETSIGDVYGNTYLDEWRKRMHSWIVRFVNAQT